MQAPVSDSVTRRAKTQVAARGPTCQTNGPALRLAAQPETVLRIISKQDPLHSTTRYQALRHDSSDARAGEAASLELLRPRGEPARPGPGREALENETVDTSTAVRSLAHHDSHAGI